MSTSVGQYARFLCKFYASFRLKCQNDERHCTCNVLFVDQSSPTFFAQRRRGCSWSTTFSIFDLCIHSGHIRDQSRKLSEIAPDFERFFSPSQILGAGHPKIVTALSTPGSRHVVWINICHYTPINSEVIDVHTLNFKPNYKFSRLKYASIYYHFRDIAAYWSKIATPLYSAPPLWVKPSDLCNNPCWRKTRMMGLSDSERISICSALW